MIQQFLYLYRELDEWRDSMLSDVTKSQLLSKLDVDGENIITNDIKKLNINNPLSNQGIIVQRLI